MAHSDIYIKFEIDPIVMLVCLARDCLYNGRGSGRCLLKHLRIDKSGNCERYNNVDKDFDDENDRP